MRTLGVVGVVAALASPASADELAMRGHAVTEIAHTVAVTFAGGVATYAVHREFRSSSKSAAEMHLEITTPTGAVATGARIGSGDRWNDATLADSAKADAAYRFSEGTGTARVLVEWAGRERLRLHAFPMPPGVTAIEYTLTVPARYKDGRYAIDYPRAIGTCAETKPTRVFVPPVVTIDHDATIDGQAITAGVATSLALPCRPETITPSESFSAITVPPSPRALRPIRSVAVDIDLDHPVPSDLTVELITPQDHHVMLHNRTGERAAGRRVVEVPADTTAAGTWFLLVRDHVPVDSGYFTGWSISFGGAPIAAKDGPSLLLDAEIPESAQLADIRMPPPSSRDWTARLGRVVTPHEAFARLEIDVAPRLSELPAHAQLVFVVDASYSMGEVGLAAELDTIRAYAHHLPDSAIEIVVYRRHAVRVFGTFVPAAELDAKLRTTTFELGNGSALDDGARLAAAALAGRTGPRRIIVMTDEKLRPAFSVPVGLASLSSLSPETVVHVVVPSRDPRGSLKRSDDQPLAALATAHHGIFAYLGLPLAPADTVLPLVRPTTIDRVSAPGLAVPDHLDEGAGIRVLAEARAVPSHVVLMGELWSDPIRRVVDVDPATSRATAAFIIASDKTLAPDDQMAVALVCSAVSPVTSYVALGSRARPQRGGDETGVEGGVCGCDVGGDPHGVIGVAPPQPPRALPDLAAMIDARACHANRDVELVIDTTGDEIVDVRGASDAMSTCVADAAWRVRLDSRFDAPRDRFTVVVRAR